MEILDFHKSIAFGETIELLELSTSQDPYYYLLNAIILRNQGKSKEALNYIDTNIDDSIISSPSRLLAFYSVKASININLGKLDLAQHQLSHCEEFYDEKGNYSLYSNLWLSDYYLLYGMLTYMLGDSVKSKEYYDLALSLNLTEEFKQIYRAKVKNNLSILYSKQGRFQKALLLLHENLPIWEELGFDFAIAQTLGNIGEIFRSQGNYNLALEQFQRILGIFLEHGRNMEILSSLSNIGSLQYLMGDAKSAKATFNEGRKYLIQDMTQYHKANFYFNHFEVEVLGGDLEGAKQVLDDFQVFSNDSEDQYVKLRYTLSKAIYLAQSNSYWEKISALFEFDRLLKTESDDFETQSRSLTYLTELLFFQYKGFQDKNILLDVANNIKKLEKIAVKENSNKFLVQAMILKSHLYIFQNNSALAKSTLLEAIAICETHGFFNLSIQVSDHYDQYLAESKQGKDEIHTISDFLEIGVSSLESKVAFESEKNICLFYLPEDNTINSNFQILRIFNGHSEIKSSVLDLIINKVSNLITVQESRKIYRYSYRDYKTILLLDSPIIVGYVYSGSSFFAQKKLEAFSELLCFYTRIIPGIIEELEKMDESGYLIESKMNLKTLVDLIYFNVSKENSIGDPEALLDGRVPINMELLPTLNIYKVLLHPLRITIMKIMESNFKLAQTDLEKIIGADRDIFESHLQTLIREKFLSNSNGTDNNKSVNYILINQLGVDAYQEFKQSLDVLLE